MWVIYFRIWTSFMLFVHMDVLVLNLQNQAELFVELNFNNVCVEHITKTWTTIISDACVKQVFHNNHYSYDGNK